MRRLAVLAATGLLAGCTVQPGDAGVTAECASGDGYANPLLVLMAQAVPSAALIPCISAVPSSWRPGDVEVRDGRGSFAFTPSSVDGPGEAVLSVVLTERCDVDGATEVPSDEPGARRYERLRDIAEGYEGERHYVYDGGCTTLTFRLPGQDRAEQVGEASLAVGFLPREDLQDSGRRRSDGRLELDDGAGAR